MRSADAGAPKGVIPFGMTALYMARIEAGLLLLDVDFHSSRFAWTDDERTTLLELGLGWMVRDLATTERVFIGRDALRREQGDEVIALADDGADPRLARVRPDHDEAGLIPPKDHTPIQDEYYLYDDHAGQLGWASSQMYSPMLQRHIALGRVPLEYAKPGCRVKLELPVSHEYEYFDAVVTRTPLYDPERRTA